MFPLALNTSMAQSFSANFLASSEDGMLCYFTGPVPQSISEIPFDAQNIYRIFENMEGCLTFTSNADSSLQSSGIQRFVGTQGHTMKATKQPYFDVSRNKWSYTPKTQIVEQIWQDMRNGNHDQLAEAWSGVYVNSIHRYLTHHVCFNFAQMGISYLWNKYRIRDFDKTAPTHSTNRSYMRYNYYGASGSRYAGSLYPLVLEFDEPISVDSFEYYRGNYSGDASSASEVTIFYWDDTLNEGQGDWVESETVALAENGSDTDIQFSELANPVEAQAFKIEMGDTASSTLHFSWFRFLSNTSPITQRESIDITWGLVIPWHQAHSAFTTYTSVEKATFLRNHNFTEDQKPSYKSQHNTPVMLVDIGDAHNQNTTVNLNKATDVKPGDVPELLNFVIEFLP